METPKVCTGHWVGQNLADQDFNDLISERAGTENTDLLVFLHGWCFIFALALHELYGYPVYCFADIYEIIDCGISTLDNPSFPQIHSFCVIGDLQADKPPVFVDCRGAIDSESLFLEEFCDFFTEYQILRFSDEQLKILRQEIWGNWLTQEQAEQYYQDAKSYIEAHSEYYKLEE